MLGSLCSAEKYILWWESNTIVYKSGFWGYEGLIPDVFITVCGLYEQQNICKILRSKAKGLGKSMFLRI